MAYESKYTGAEVDALLDKIKDDDVGNIDSSLSTTSENPVMNKVVTEELNKKLESSDMATINGQPLTEGGNIEVEAEPYDDTEIRDNLSELAEEIESNGVLIEVLQNMKIDKENDDYYPKMAVGLADNLAGVDVVDSEINFRRSGGGAISDGVARIESIKGNSSVVNQKIARTYKTSTHNGVTFTVNNDGSVTANGTAEAFAYLSALRRTVYPSRKYFVSGGVADGSSETYSFGDGNNLNCFDSTPIIANAIREGTVTFAFRVQAGVSVENLKFPAPVVIDLTQMFGPGYEPTTIDEFYARIPMGVDLNAYNEGEVIHMDVQSIESVGANAWDEEWELGTITEAGIDFPSTTTIRTANMIPVLPNTAYVVTSLTTKMLYLYYFDENENFIAFKYLNNITQNATAFTTPQGCRYVRFSAVGTTYNHDICINLSDPSINGKYFPYIKRVEDLSIIHKYFPDGMKSAGTAHDEIRYNKASGKWEYSKGRMKSVDLGTLNWSYFSAFNCFATTTLVSAVKGTSDPLAVPNIITIPYSANSYYNFNDGSPNGVIALNIGGTLMVRDTTYTDATSFKAAMQGVILYYEAADWEWVELDAEDQYKDLDYQVWNAGTEKANAEGKSAPLAADITYGFNAIGKIKELEQAIKALQTAVASL